MKSIKTPAPKKPPRALRVLNEDLHARKCGECNACCVVYAIDDEQLTKGEHERCPHLDDDGCSVYDARPKTCRAFECFWLKGMGPLEHRPDKIGIVFSAQSTNMPLHAGMPKIPGVIGRMLEKTSAKMGSVVAFVASELHAGAATDGAGADVVNEIAAAAPVFIIRHDGTRTVRAPHAWLKVVREMIRAKGGKVVRNGEG